MLTLLLVLLLVLPAHAAIIWVDPAGSNTGSCGASSPASAACRTPDYAANNRMSGGDTVRMRAGTYPNSTSMRPPSGGGEGSRSIVEGDPAVADRNTIIVQPVPGTSEAIYTTGKSYITFQHFKIEGAPAGQESDTNPQAWDLGYAYIGGDPGSDHHITFNDINVKHTRNSAILCHSCDQFRITNNDFQFVGRRYSAPPWCTTNSPGCSNATGCTDNIASDCDCQSHCDAHGLYWSGTNSLIQNNVFFQPYAEWNAQNYGGDDTGNTFDRNEFKGGHSGCLTLTNGSSILVTNNVCYPLSHNFSPDGNPSHVLPANGGFFTQTPNIRVYNNTFDGAFWSNDDSSTTAKNNLLCNTTKSWSPNPTEDHNVVGCTGLVNPGNHDYRLSAGASQINAGVNVSDAPTMGVDKVGTTRTGNPDIGAYEFVSAGPPVATGIIFQTSPSNVAVGASITPAIQVAVVDQFGALMPTASATIGLAIGFNAGGATLAGGGNTATSGGVATFSGVQLSAPGTNYTLIATASGLPNPTVTSGPFNVSGPSTACTSPCTVFVNPATGLDTRPCNAATLGNARQTLAGGLACMTVGGSTLNLRTGTYDGCIDTAMTPIASGSTGAPTVITAYAGEAVTLAPTAPTATACQAVAIFRNSEHDITLSGLTLDAGNRTDSNGLVFYPGSHHMRFQNGIVRNTFYEGVFITNSSDNVLSDSTIEQSAWYGINVTDSSTRNLFDNLIVRNHANQGIFIINGSIFTVNRVTLTGNGVSGTLPAIRVGGTGNSGSLIANSVVAGNYAGIDITSGASGLKVYNNTVANNTNAGVTISAGATGTLLTNTIMAGNAPGQDLVNTAGTSTVQTTLLFTNPGFDGGATCPYCLTPAATSAINVGTVLTADVPLDRAGLPRPQGSGFDIGAYECPDPCAPCEAPPEPVSQLKTPVWQSGGFFRK